MRSSGYDIIGDIHGHADELEALLVKMGYRFLDGCYRHPERRVIFLGDFIDRGPKQRRVLQTVMPMVKLGGSKAVMGNHEFNALAFHTPDPSSAGQWLRPRTNKNISQHIAFLNEYLHNDMKGDLEEVLDFFRSLPLWLELDGIRVVHACWDKKMIRDIGSPMLTDELLKASSTGGTWQYEAIETILKGKEIPLPDGHVFHDKDGNARHDIRVRWWDQTASRYSMAFLGPESARTHIPDDEIVGDHLIEYSHDESPVFLGHYWMEGEPAPLARNIACTDYSVAKLGGKLAAYRWGGETELKIEKFVTVDRVENINS